MAFTSESEWLWEARDDVDYSRVPLPTEFDFVAHDAASAYFSSITEAFSMIFEATNMDLTNPSLYEEAATLIPSSSMHLQLFVVARCAGTIAVFGEGPPIALAMAGSLANVAEAAFLKFRVPLAEAATAYLEHADAGIAVPPAFTLLVERYAFPDPADVMISDATAKALLDWASTIRLGSIPARPHGFFAGIEVEAISTTRSSSTISDDVLVVSGREFDLGWIIEQGRIDPVDVGATPAIEAVGDVLLTNDEVFVRFSDLLEVAAIPEKSLRADDSSTLGAIDNLLAELRDTVDPTELPLISMSESSLIILRGRKRIMYSLLHAAHDGAGRMESIRANYLSAVSLAPAHIERIYVARPPKPTESPLLPL